MGVSIGSAKINNMHILLTGSTGLLGSTLLPLLKKKEHTVEPFKGDIADAEDVSSVHLGFDWVIHAAAMTDVNACEREKKRCHEVNALGVKNMVEAARRCSAGFTYVSTVSVFDGAIGNYKESDSPNPSNEYNKSKHAGECYALLYERSVIVRANIIGIHPSGNKGKNFLEWLSSAYENNRDITLFTDVRINPLSNHSLALLLEDLMNKKIETPILHLASRNVLSKAEVGDYVRKKFPKYTGKVSYASVDSLPGGAVRPKEMWLNAEETMGRYGWSAPTVEKEIEGCFHEKN